ncbi:MAG: FecR domain-containing protein, partial [Elusimicrobia bacterium]|nr:FecR domain-containing protein [Elusimicrobiota bacterium]
MVDSRTAVSRAAIRRAHVARAVLFLSAGLWASVLVAAEPTTPGTAPATASATAPAKKTVRHSRKKHARKSLSAKTAMKAPAKTAAVPASPATPASASQVKPAAVAKPVAAKPAPAASSTVPATRAAGKAIESHLETFTRTVEVQPGNLDWRKAEKKMPLVTSDKVRTGVNATARIKLADGSKVMLLPRSQVEMESMTTVEKSIRLLRGRLRAIITRAHGGNNFKVTTPVGVASVRGTDFEVEVGDKGDDMEVRVFEGQVGVSKLGDLGKEVILNAGDRIEFGAEKEIGDPIRSGGLPMDRMEIRSEMQLASAKDSIVAMAAEESRNADYQVGKSAIDVNGSRVRVEEYIMRPAANQFKLVVLNDRPTRFDYFTYKGTFNTTLPDDLSVALKQVSGKLGSTAPDYYLTGYETVMSNTIDHINETASGGHLV